MNHTSLRTATAWNGLPDVFRGPRALRLVGGTPCEPEGSQTDAVTELDVRTVQALRRKRGRFFDPALFADPGWDILLELYAAHLGQHRVTVTNLCMAVEAPTTTALRWLAVLERRDMVRRTPDPTDRRRIFVALVPDAFEAMNRFFKGAPAP